MHIESILIDWIVGFCLELRSDVGIRFILIIKKKSKNFTLKIYLKNLHPIQIKKEEIYLCIGIYVKKNKNYLLNLIFSKVFLALFKALISSFVDGVFNFLTNMSASAPFNVGVGFTLLAIIKTSTIKLYY